MGAIELVSDHTAPFLLVLFRFAGVFVIAPVAASILIPMQVRMLLAAILALCVYPTIPPEQMSHVRIDLFSLGAAVAGEMLIGVSLGMIAVLPTVAMQLAGRITDQQLGLGLADVFDPATGASTSLIGQLYMYVAISVFLALDGLEILFYSCVMTFENVPLGGFGLTGAPLGLLLAMLDAGFNLAIRISAPILGIVAVEMLATGFIAKTMPQLNILSVGFALKVLLGLLALVGSISVLHVAVENEIGLALRHALTWVSGGGGSG